MRFVRLKHVVEVDRCGSITAAANALNTTQSTVTKSVAAMEQELGFALFIRRSRGVVATEKGREFLNRAARLLSDYEYLVEDSRQEMAAANTLVRLGVCPALLQGLLNRPICEFVQKCPNVRIQLQAISSERGVQLLNRGDVDLLIGPVGILSQQSEFRYELMPAIKAGLYVRKDHELAKRKSVAREDIKAYPIIATDPINPYTDQLLQLLRETDVADPLRQLHIVDYYPIAAQMVLATDAVSLISTEYASSSAFREKFKLLPLDIFEPLEMACAWRSRSLPNQTVRHFVSGLSKRQL